MCSIRKHLTHTFSQNMVKFTRGRGRARGTLRGCSRPREGGEGERVVIKRNCSAINYPVRSVQFEKTAVMLLSAYLKYY